MASANFDGQWIARIIERLGNRTVAGSTSRGGARALIAMKREIEKGSPAAFALDGPRGPPASPSLAPCGWRGRQGLRSSRFMARRAGSGPLPAGIRRWCRSRSARWLL